jgi:hypothetical protein
MKIARWLGIALGVLLLGLAAVTVVARFQDGPVAVFQGGVFTSGEVADAGNVDWSFVRAIENIELQLLEPARSRTTWILDQDGEIFIPCGIPEFRIWKQWPHQALADGRARLRVEGKIYDVQLVRIDDEALRGRLVEQIGEKYGHNLEPELIWIFRLDPRASTAARGTDSQEREG